MDESNPKSHQADPGEHSAPPIQPPVLNEIKTTESHEVSPNEDKEAKTDQANVHGRQLKFITSAKAWLAKLGPRRRPINRERAKWTDKTMAFATIVIMLWAGLQWWEMHGTGSQTDNLIDAARIQARALSRNAIIAQKMAGDNRDALTKTLGQAQQALNARSLSE